MDLLSSKRLLLIALTAVALLTTPTSAWPMAEQPAVTDPDDPRFNPKEFRLENYNYASGNEGQLNKALAKVFPPGTDKTYIDEILIKQGSSKWVKNQTSEEYYKPGETDYSYAWSPSGLGGIVVNFVFDAHDKAIMMKHGATLLYGVDPYSRGGKQ